MEKTLELKSNLKGSFCSVCQFVWEVMSPHMLWKIPLGIFCICFSQIFFFFNILPAQKKFLYIYAKHFLSIVAFVYTHLRDLKLVYFLLLLCISSIRPFYRRRIAVYTDGVHEKDTSQQKGIIHIWQESHD